MYEQVDRQTLHNCAAPKVLLTNDDGPSSPFFEMWHEHLSNVLQYVGDLFGAQKRLLHVISKVDASVIGHNRWECSCVVPSTHCSFMGKALSKEPFKVQLVKDNQWLADAPPATCINLGCFSLAPHTDLVIAGPDVGHNVGRAALLASGTIGAAIEGSLSGRKSMAVSFSYYRRFGSWTEAELAAAIELAGRLCKQYWEQWPSDTVDVVSINIPLGFRTIDGQPPHTTPVVVCPQEPTALYRKLYAPVQPGSTLYVWKPDEVRPTAAAEGRDFSEIMAGHATVSFLQARFTDVHV